MIIAERYIVIVLLSPGPALNWYLMRAPFDNFDACMQHIDSDQFRQEAATLPKPTPGHTVNIGCMTLEMESY